MHILLAVDREGWVESLVRRRKVGWNDRPVFWLLLYDTSLRTVENWILIINKLHTRILVLYMVGCNRG